jgi:RND superfamily putative drug exporter
MTKDRTITKITIVLKDNPYSLEAQDTLQKMNTTVDHVVARSILKDAEVGISGTTATASDMTHILSTDLNRMIVIVLIGIFIILVILTRSIWEPIAIILSLIGSYYVATFATNKLFLNVFGLDGIQSFVPFFTFIIIVALGVDYSIFLMMRYKECSHLSHKEAIITASKNIGGVVISAVIILGGTFATLIPSGVAILVQLGVAIIIGLAVLCLVMLPFFLPAMIALPGVLKKIKK